MKRELDPASENRKGALKKKKIEGKIFYAVEAPSSGGLFCETNVFGNPQRK